MYHYITTIRYVYDKKKMVLELTPELYFNKFINLT